MERRQRLRPLRPSRRAGVPDLNRSAKKLNVEQQVDTDIHSLHRYYCWTTLLKRDFESALAKGDWLPSKEESPVLFPWKYMASDVGMYMSYWYGALYVVCEGWIDLKLSDPRVDALLASPNLDLLKRYRNGAFHFQRKYFDPRFLDFQASQDSVAWVRDLSLALGAWFLAYLRSHPGGLTQKEGPNLM